MDTDYFLNNFNTFIPPEKFGDFYNWVSSESESQGRDITMDMEDYDIQGYWLSGDWGKKDVRGHGSDRWKKPNHPTFSNESIYHGKEWLGGEWGEKKGKGFFKPGKTNLELWQPEGLQKYFREREPGIELLLP